MRSATWSLARRGPHAATAAVAVAGLAGAAAGQSCQPAVDPGFASGRFDGAVLAAVEHDNGGGPQWYLGGGFTSAGGVPAGGVVRWTDRRNYTPLGSGVSGGLGVVHALTVHDPDGPGPLAPRLIVAGHFDTAGGQPVRSVAAWDGSAWHAVGAGLSSGGGPATVRALAVIDGVLYAGGLIDASGATPVVNLARLGGAGWEPVGAGVGFEVLTLAPADVGGPALFVAGEGSAVLRFDGSALSTFAALAGAPPLRVNELRAGAAGLVVAGRFDSIAGTAARNIAWLSAGGVQALGSGVGTVSDEATSAVFEGADLLVVGRFAAAGGVPAANAARWNGSWSALGSGLPSAPARIVGLGGPGETAALGAFADERSVRLFDPASQAFRGLDAGLQGSFGVTVRAMVSANPGFQFSGRQLFLSGTFTTAGTTTATALVRYDGRRFHAIPAAERPSAAPAALARLEEKEGDLLLVGGAFGLPFPRFYGIDLSGTPRRFAPEPGLAGDEVRAILALPDRVLVGGNFRASGPSPAYFAQYSLFNPGWSAHSAGAVNGPVNTLAGGDFTMDGVPDVFGGGLLTQGGIGGPTAPFALQNGFFINGATGTMNAPAVNGFHGVEGQILTSTVPDTPFDHTNFLFMGGDITRAGGITAGRVAPWHGDHWHFMAQGVNGRVRALAMFNDGSGNGPELYVAGDFSSASGLNTPYLAKWDGTAWAPVLTGLDGPGHALAVHNAGDGLGPCLYIAGDFSTFGGVSCQRLARLIPCQGCLADWNLDGTVDFNDFLAFLNDFNAALPRADLNADGTIDFNDFLVFLNLFSAGC
ncbi:MAG: hypothetical protein FJ255_06750 [Phycisphaerae bacterium]|nr:hypothetical protein [Phycisphaerae bacterium]